MGDKALDLDLAAPYNLVYFTTLNLLYYALSTSLDSHSARAEAAVYSDPFLFKTHYHR
jgi:hypothetical protein